MADAVETILNKVKGHREVTEDRRVRMEGDYVLWRLEQYDAGEDYESYTSNEPRAYADKIIAWLVDSVLTIRMPQTNSQNFERRQMSAKERFLIGILDSADERLTDMILPSVREQLAWHICLRGWWASLSLLRKLKDGSTIVDMTPWDPMHTYWGIGKGGKLAWACLHMRKTSAEIMAEYEFKVESDTDDDEGHDIYSYYDDTDHVLILGSGDENAENGTLLRKPEPHGARAADGSRLWVPVSIGAVGATPPIQGYNHSGGRAGNDYNADPGDSIYGADRRLYEIRNQVMSIMLELVARSQKPGMKVKSRDGSKTLDEDPFKQGSEISLAEGDDVEALDPLRMAIDTLPFLGNISSEIQRGAIPYSAFGELSFQLSGFAINSLNDNIGTILQPRIAALQRAYRQICMMPADQYEGGGYQSFQINGFDINRDYFSEQIEPDVIKGTGTPLFEITAILPADDQGKMQLASVARQLVNGRPMLPDPYIWDTILQIQNPDELKAQIDEQIAQQASPKAMLYTLIDALLERGNMPLAIIYKEELENIILREFMAKQQMLLGGGLPPGPGGPQQGAPPGQVPSAVPPNLPPEILPSQLQGVPQAPPTPQAGPNVPPGTPRPGAQTGGSP